MACAKGKRLPVCVCVKEGWVLRPLALRQYAAPRPPYGCGNAACLDPETIHHLAESASVYLKEVEDYFAVRVRGIAIDAPSNPRSVGVVLREAERGLSTRGMSYFQTPDEVEIAAMTTMARRHLADGGPVTHLPHGNRLWMLLGFELFSRLRQEGWECLEVFPQAIAVALGAAAIHKSKTDGLLRQLNAVATFTG